MSDINEQAKPEQPKAPVKLVKPDTTEANTKVRLAELTNVNRIVSNAINLINDVEIKGAHAQPVVEILGWLTGFSLSLTDQMKTLESTLPKITEAKKVEPKIIAEDAPKVLDKTMTTPTK